METEMKMIHLGMVYIYKIPAKKNLSHNFIAFTNVRHFFRNTNLVPKCKSVRDFGVASATGKSNLQMLHDLRFKYPKIFALWLSQYK